MAVAAALLFSGCAGPETKLGRGVSNTFEVIRWGDMSRTIEQTALFGSPSEGYTTGMVRGFDKSVSRIGIGVYEVITFPIPPYHPIATRYLTPGPAYTASYQPGLISDPLFDTDTYSGFSGGEVAPWFPNSRFRVFDN